MRDLNTIIKLIKSDQIPWQFLMIVKICYIYTKKALKKFSIALQSIVPEYGFRSNHVCRHAIGKLLDETVKNKIHITTLYNIQETRALWYSWEMFDIVSKLSGKKRTICEMQCKLYTNSLMN